jgi:hypothetical protein
MAKDVDDNAKRDGLKLAIYEFMPLIDGRLAGIETPVGTRAFSAAADFVKHFVLEVSNDDNKDDFAEKPWFAIIYHHVNQWYRETYGDALEKDSGRTACGVVLIRDLPIELTVPLTRSRVETPGETAWLIFPVTVDVSENPLTWLKGAPNIALLSDPDKARALKDATDVATALRCLRMNLMGVEPQDDNVSGLLEGVLAEFESAARQMLRAEASGRASALWTLQMAVERVLKAFAQHKAGTFRQIHNLFELFDDISSYGTGVDRELLKKLPRDRDVMGDRYGLRGTPTVWEMFEAYNAALSITSGIAPHFKRKFNVGGGRFLLRKAPWTTLPSDKSLPAPGKPAAAPHSSDEPAA